MKKTLLTLFLPLLLTPISQADSNNAENESKYNRIITKSLANGYYGDDFTIRVLGWFDAAYSPTYGLCGRKFEKQQYEKFKTSINLMIKPENGNDRTDIFNKGKEEFRAHPFCKSIAFKNTARFRNDLIPR